MAPILRDLTAGASRLNPADTSIASVEPQSPNYLSATPRLCAEHQRASKTLPGQPSLIYAQPWKRGWVVTGRGL